MLTVVVLAAAT